MFNERRHPSQLNIFTIILFSYCYATISATSYFCEKDQEVKINTTSGRIFTRYEGDSYYKSNQQCKWMIDAGPGSNRRIQVRIVNSDIQWAPESAICNGYDYVEIYNGVDMDAPSIVSFCGKQNPRSVMSTGQFLFLTFGSNDRVNANYRGVTMDFEVFETSDDPGSCPPGWVDNANDTLSNSCYTVKTHKETYNDGQMYCHYDQSNLVSFAHESEADFVTEMLTDHLTSSEQAWIGLNDITVNGQYVWIDNISSTVKYRWYKKPHVPNEFWHCVAIRGKDFLWEEIFCTESEVQTLDKYIFVCKMNRVGETPLYRVPPERPEGHNPQGNNLLWLIVCIVPIVLIIVAVLCVNRNKAKSPPRRDNNGDVDMTAMNSSFQSAPTAPPSYEDAISETK